MLVYAKFVECLTPCVEYDSRLRTDRLNRAVELFHRSLEVHETPAAHYHLALALARPGPSQDLAQAVTNAQAAVEGAATEIRFWHLLGLLLAATEQWKAARGVFEVASAIGEPEEEDPTTPTLNGNGSIVDHDFAHNASPSDPEKGAAAGTSSDQSDESYTYFPSLLSENHSTIPAAEGLLQPLGDHPAPSQQDLFEQALQLRMSEMTLCETVDGAERAEDRWVEIFDWVARKTGVARDAGQPTSEHGWASIDSWVIIGHSFDVRRSMETSRPASQVTPTNEAKTFGAKARLSTPTRTHVSSHASQANGTSGTPHVTVTPASPGAASRQSSADDSSSDEKESSIGHNRKPKKGVHHKIRSGVKESGARIQTIGRKIGNNIAQGGLHHLKRSTSFPSELCLTYCAIQQLMVAVAFSSESQSSYYQASSIHSRRGRLSFLRTDTPPPQSPPPPPPVPLPAPSIRPRNKRSEREDRLLCNLWLMSAATFRRLGRVEQAKGSIQEAEVRDERNPAVWVQVSDIW